MSYIRGKAKKNVCMDGLRWNRCSFGGRFQGGSDDLGAMFTMNRLVQGARHKLSHGLSDV